MSELKAQLSDIKRVWRWALALGGTAAALQAGIVVAAAVSGDQLLRSTDPAPALWFAAVVTTATALTIALAHISRRILDRAALWIDHTIARTVFADQMAATASSVDAGDPALQTDALSNAFSSSLIATAVKALCAPAFILALLAIDFRAAAVASVIYAVGIGIVLGGMSGRKPIRDEAGHRARAISSAEPRHVSMLRATGLDTAIQSVWLTHKTRAIAATYGRLRTNGRWSFAANVWAALSLLGATLLAIAALQEGMINRFGAVLAIATIAWITYAVRSAIMAAPALGAARSAWRNLLSRTLKVARPSQPTAQDIISIENASIVQPARRHAILSGISITCQPGETVVISGSPGSGKSALAALIAGAVAPAEGRHHNAGLRIGYVPELPLVVEGTVAQNIARFTRYDLHAVMAAIDRAGVNSVLDERNLSLEMPIHSSLLQPLGALSLREARAVNLARAVFVPIDVLVIDKPELAMEPTDVHAIVTALRHLRASGVGLVIATNDARFHSLADRHFHLESGRIMQASLPQASHLPQYPVTRSARGPRFAIAR